MNAPNNPYHFLVHLFETRNNPQRLSPSSFLKSTELSHPSTHPHNNITTPIAKHQRKKSCRSEEHTSELQSRENLVCRLLLENKHAPTDKHQHLAVALDPL